MIDPVIALAAVAWIASGLLCYGLSFALFQRHFAAISDDMYCKHWAFCLKISLLGPIGLAIVLVFLCINCRPIFKYGLKFK